MNLHPPPVFLPSPGKPPIPWEEWMQLFTTYMEACGGTGYASTLSSTVDETEDVYAAAVQSLQHPGESIDEFITGLRTLSANCKFEVMAEDIICDHFLEKTSSQVVRDRLLLEPDLTLDTALAIANVYHEKLSHDYSKAIISTEGVFSATVCFGNRTATCRFHEVRKGAAIAGMDMLRALDIAIVPAQQRCRKVSATPAVQVPPCLTKYPTLLSEELRLAKRYRHKVTIRTSLEPVQQKLRRLPLEFPQIVSEELQELERSDIIERVDASEWVSPIVAVWKKTGELRLCVDLRKPNTAIVIDSHPLPHMKDIFHHLAGASYFSKLDLSSAYHQMELAEESRNLTAFIIHDGLFRYKRVCFGLASAAAAFQKMLAMVLKGLKGVLHYLDDILVYGTTMGEHNLRLHRVLFALDAAGLRLNKNKSVFATRQLQFLGHSLSPDGMSPL
ncbi:uncharacterized protein K02A2.6-like [Ornithodoros turicata]|uniref:uncharacterized protein K02A2.6-like n=1 Tax=Ornithodoros turicata TaxID=34597 RepID=UPI003138EC45